MRAMSKPRVEVRVAAHWWADRLREGAKQDAADGMINAFATWASGTIPQPTTEQIDRFEVALADELESFLDTTEWDPDRPDWGSCYRCVDVDYGPCRELANAIEAAGISRLHLPIKTTMRIDPGRVQVGYGYGAPFEDVEWTDPEPEEKHAS